MNRSALIKTSGHGLAILCLVGPVSWLWTTRVQPWRALQDRAQEAAVDRTGMERSLADQAPTLDGLERERLDGFLERYPTSFSWHDTRNTLLVRARDHELHLNLLRHEIVDEDEALLAGGPTEMPVLEPLLEMQPVGPVMPPVDPMTEVGPTLDLTVESVRVEGVAQYQPLFAWLHDVRAELPGCGISALEVRRLDGLPEWVSDDTPVERWPTLTFSLTLSVAWRQEDSGREEAP